MRTPYHDLIKQVATEHALDSTLVEAIVIQESYGGHTDAFRFEPAFYDRYLKGKPEWAGQNPRRIASSYGLMQVMYTTAVQDGFTGEPELLFIPYVGLDYGCRRLHYLLGWSTFNIPQALAAYNGGKGNWQADRPQRYALKVLGHQRTLV